MKRGVLRCGDIEAAMKAVRNAGPDLSDTHTLLQELATSLDNRLPSRMEGMYVDQYRNFVRHTTDPYKRAVYCVVGAYEPYEEHQEQEVVTCLDDYMWLKLCLVHEDVGGDGLTLSGLQSMLTEDEKKDAEDRRTSQSSIVAPINTKVAKAKS